MALGLGSVVGGPANESCDATADGDDVYIPLPSTPYSPPTVHRLCHIV